MSGWHDKDQLVGLGWKLSSPARSAWWATSNERRRGLAEIVAWHGIFE
jgi:hypothetical protein